jgi:hypothetical protein
MGEAEWVYEVLSVRQKHWVDVPGKESVDDYVRDD